MIPSQIHKVLSTMRSRQVAALLMGGQACVFYGAAEFSKDTDFAILADAANLGRLAGALEDLGADQIAVPPFAVEYLERGHAVHFRCQHPDAVGLRVDVMAKMRGVAPFPELWERRTDFEDGSGEVFTALSLPDLVQAKKTQRNKDWPMLERLLNVHFFEHQTSPQPAQVAFWFRELRTVELLTEAAARFPAAFAEALPVRPAVLTAVAEGDRDRIEAALADEQARERALDRAYWEPLKRELEGLRRRRA